MFERIKAYKNLKKFEKFAEECKTIAEYTDDKEMLKYANDSLYYIARLRRIIWRDRKTAEKYNLGIIRIGL